MVKKIMAVVTLISFFGSQAVFAEYALWDWGFNVDGIAEVEGDGGSPTSFGQNLDGFDPTTGIGTVTFSINGTGSHNVDAFFDHELNQTFNTFFNETAFKAGSMEKPEGTEFNWEVDEPGFYFGGIVDNLYVSDFDGEIFPGLAEYEAKMFIEDPFLYPIDGADDVSVGMGWDFDLAEGQTATVSFFVSESFDVNSGAFYVLQQDNYPNEDGVIEKLYFTSSIQISGGATNVPEPGVVSLITLSIFFSGLIFVKRKSNYSGM